MTDYIQYACSGAIAFWSFKAFNDYLQLSQKQSEEIRAYKKGKIWSVRDCLYGQVESVKSQHRSLINPGNHVSAFEDPNKLFVRGVLTTAQPLIKGNREYLTIERWESPISIKTDGSSYSRNYDMLDKSQQWQSMKCGEMYFEDLNKVELIQVNGITQSQIKSNGLLAQGKQGQNYVQEDCQAKLFQVPRIGDFISKSILNFNFADLQIGLAEKETKVRLGVPGLLFCSLVTNKNNQTIHLDDVRDFVQNTGQVISKIKEKRSQSYKSSIIMLILGAGATFWFAYTLFKRIQKNRYRRSNHRFY